MIIVGAGVGGLAAALRLSELGLFSTVLEANQEPIQKVCGEFLSPECLPLLERWGVHPARLISKAHYIAGSQELKFSLPAQAGTLSRPHCERQMGQEAKRRGVDLRYGTSVCSIQSIEGGNYVLALSSGELLQTDRLLIASGRFSKGFEASTSSVYLPPMRYVGIKAHFTGIDLTGTLEMHLLSDAYLGICPIEQGRVNVACLARKRADLDPEELWSVLMQQAGSLRARFMGAERVIDWVRTEVPGFGLRKVRVYPNVYYLGDAMGSIAPVSGEGLAMAMASGCLAAEFSALGLYESYPAASRRLFKKRIRWANWLNHAVLTPGLVKIGLLACHLCPTLPAFLFSRTRC